MAESTIIGQDKKIPCSDWLRTQVGKMDHLVRISHIGPGRKSSLFRYKFMINPLFTKLFWPRWLHDLSLNLSVHKNWLRTQVGKMDHLVRISHIGPGRKSSLFRYKFMINPLFTKLFWPRWLHDLSLNLSVHKNAKNQWINQSINK